MFKYMFPIVLGRGGLERLLSAVWPRNKKPDIWVGLIRERREG